MPGCYYYSWSRYGLETEAGLAVMLEIPLLICDIQREVLLRETLLRLNKVIYYRHIMAEMGIVQCPLYASTPNDCFDTVFMKQCAFNI
jgi:hypothetical protein